MRGRLGDERGSAVVEVAVLLPVVLTVLLALFQVAVIAHANQVATAAAREGARVARSEGGSTAAGKARAQQVLKALGGSKAAKAIVDADVTASRDSDGVVVEVRGRAPSFVGSFSVYGKAGGPVERFRPATEP